MTSVVAGSLFCCTPTIACAQGAPPAAPGTPQANSRVPADQAAPLGPATPQESDTFDLEAALVTADRGLTSDEAGKVARERAPQVSSAEASAEIAHWDAEVQKTALYPTLNVSGQYKRISKVTNDVFSFVPPSTTGGAELPDFTQPLNNYTLLTTARWPVSDLFLRAYPALKAARSVADARNIEIEARIANADLTAREAFYGHAKALAAHIVAEQAVKQAEAQAAQAKLFVGAGTAAPVDYMTAIARVGSMRAALARARGAVAVTRNALATYMGIESTAVTGIRERVTALPGPPAGSVEEFLKRGLEQRPELRAMRKMIGASNLIKKSEKASAYPVLSVEGTDLYGNPNPRYVPPLAKFRNSWEVGATISWSPNSARVGYQRTQRASADILRAQADLIALEDGVRIEVVQSFEDYGAAVEVAEASVEQLKAAEETYRVRLATYRVGAGEQIDLLAADLALNRARLEQVNAVLDAHISLARLARATGTVR